MRFPRGWPISGGSRMRWVVHWTKASLPSRSTKTFARSWFSIPEETAMGRWVITDKPKPRLEIVEPRTRRRITPEETETGPGAERVASIPPGVHRCRRSRSGKSFFVACDRPGEPSRFLAGTRQNVAGSGHADAPLRPRYVDVHRSRQAGARGEQFSELRCRRLC